MKLRFAWYVIAVVLIADKWGLMWGLAAVVFDALVDYVIWMYDAWKSDADV